MENEKNKAAVEVDTERETWEDMENAQEQTSEEDGVDLLVKFRKPYTFEGQTYTEVDLHGLEDVTAGQLEAVGRMLLKKRPNLNPATLEMNMEYTSLLAMKVTGKPLEFFERLPCQEGVKIKTAVVGFLYGGGLEG